MSRWHVTDGRRAGAIDARSRRLRLASVVVVLFFLGACLAAAPTL